MLPKVASLFICRKYKNIDIAKSNPVKVYSFYVSILGSTLTSQDQSITKEWFYFFKKILCHIDVHFLFEMSIYFF